LEYETAGDYPVYYSDRQRIDNMLREKPLFYSFNFTTEAGEWPKARGPVPGESTEKPLEDRG
jgi:hypothetical protein